MVDVDSCHLIMGVVAVVVAVGFWRVNWGVIALVAGCNIACEFKEYYQYTY